MKPRYEVAVGLGENLRRCRRRAGLSQEGLSFRSSVPRPAIGTIARGESLRPGRVACHDGKLGSGRAVEQVLEGGAVQRAGGSRNDDHS